MIVDRTTAADDTGPEDTGETSADEDTGTEVAAGVIVDGQAVMMAGLLGTCAAQIPMR